MLDRLRSLSYPAGVSTSEPTELERLILETESRWEDPYVDFKRQLSLKNNAEKVEFVKDVLGLVNTKGTSRRFLMIGWDDKTRLVRPPGIDSSLKVEQLQHILNAYCETPPHLELSRCIWGSVPIGVIEIKREDVKVPYRVGKAIGPLKPEDVFVRHGTTTERPSPTELDGLRQEGLNARLREAANPLIRPDQTALHFAPLGLMMGGLLPPAAAARHQAITISVPIADAVPKLTRQLFERLQTLHMHGLWSPESQGVGGSGYQLFTLAHEYSLQVLEHAFAARFIDYYAGSVDLIDSAGQVKSVQASSIADLYAVLDGHRWRVTSRRDPTKRLTFSGSLKDLFAWARHEGLLRGQSTRRFDYVFPRMLARNRPIEYRLGSPPDSSLTIREVAEFINQLWGENTPNGDVFPEPSERQVFVLGWNAEDTESRVFRPDSFRNEAAKPGWTFITVLCTSGDELLDRCHSDFAVTTFPSQVLLGPDDWTATATFLETYEGANDHVQNLDQYFVLPIGRDEWARTPNQFAGLSGTAHAGRWVLIQADSPWAAYRHMQSHAISPETHRLRGSCDHCWVECRATGGWRRMLLVLAAMNVSVVPELPRGIGRPKPGSTAPELREFVS